MQKQISVISETNKASVVIPTVVPDFENNNELVRLHLRPCVSNFIFQFIAREEMLKQIIFDCRKMFVCEDAEDCFGTWLLIDDSDSNE